ncbi:TetR/AcrR family transcriptional regulator [Ilumatobacter sp.]|uniref:TetR/AcrR family transcriptional regulator n=1 Tax=Ilumatobacter sp. TaxID=1967498 RepID=UPI003B51DA9B
METAHVAPVRQRNARGEGDRLRVELLDAAADLLAEHGSVDAVSLRAVARRAGVSATAVYRHFDDHGELVRAAVRHCWDNFAAALHDAHDDEADPFEEFFAAGRAYADFARRRSGQYRVMFSDHAQFEGETEMVAAATFQVLVDLVSAVLVELDDDRDPTAVSVQVHTWIHGIVDLDRACHGPGWPPVDQQLAGLAGSLGLLPPC